MATAWLDERDPEALWLARGIARPLWLARGRHGVFFASTRKTLDLVAQVLRMHLRPQELGEGRLLRVTGRTIERTLQFTPDRTYTDDGVLPPVRAPHEGAWCLQRLAVIASLA
jgi:hypothetical protein